MKQRLASLLDVDRRETRTVLLLWAQSFCIGLAIVCYETAVTALFLGAFGVANLPLVYIWASAVGVAFGFGYLHLEKRLKPAVLFQATVMLILLGFLGIRLLLAVSSAKGAYLAAMIWVDLTIIFLSLQFWSQAGLLLTVRQGKRLFGVIGSGECAGIVIGGVVLPLLVRAFGTLNLVVCAAVATALCLLLLRRTVTGLREDTGLEEDGEAQYSVREMLRTPYFRLLFGHALLLVLSGYFVDFLFYSVAEARFEDERSLASFLGPFFALVGVVAFLTKLFAFNRIMRRFGVLGGLLTVPLSVTVAVVAALLGARFFPAAGLGGFTWFFGFVVLAKTLDIGLRTGVSEPTNALLFQPIPAARRVRVQSFSNSVAEPLFRGLAGVLLLVVSAVLGWESSQVTWAVLLLFVLLGGYCFAVRRGYAGQLIETFGKRRLPAGDATAGLDLESLRRYLRSPEPGEVIYVLGLLATHQEDGRIEADLLEALEHSAPEVRLEALRLLETRGRNRTVARLDELLRLRTHDGPVLAAAVRTYCQLVRPAAIRVIAPLLDHAEPAVARAALVGLVRQEDPSGLRALEAMLASPDPLLRGEAARVLADLGDSSRAHLLTGLLRDADPRVRRLAIHAAGSLASRHLVPDLVKLLGEPELEPVARLALTRSGADAVPELKRQFEALPAGAPERLALIRALSGIPDADAVAFLDRLLETADVDLRTALAEGLAHLKFRPDAGRRAFVIALVERDLALLNDNRTDEALCSGLPLLRRALAAERVAGIHRIFNFLRLLKQPDAALLAARTRFLLGDEHQQALALELLDNVLDGELRIKAVAAFERLRRSPEREGHPDEALTRLVARAERDSGTFLKAAILWTIWHRDPAGVPPLLANLNATGAPVLRETAGFCSRARAATEAHDLLISKTELLAGVSIFAATPITELVELAGLLRPRPLAAGSRLLNEGEPGTGLYLVVAGKVRVHKGGRELARPGPGSVIGELAALDPEPRAASVTAVEESIVLELDGAQLREFMARRPSVAQGVFRFLCDRIRSTAGPELDPPRLDGRHRSFEAREGSGEEGFPLFEKCRALARVTIFRDVPGSVLAAVGRRVIVKFARKDQLIIQHGEVGESLFVLVAGRARVHHGERTLARLEQGAVFGELAALAPEPRTASVTATEEATLFQISGRVLYELAAESPELVTGVTRALCHQLRERLRQLDGEGIAE